MNEYKPPRAVQVGDIIGEMDFGPISRTMLCLYAGASLDHNPIHIDSDFAQQAGQDDVFAHGMLGMAQLGRLVTNWAGVDHLERLSTRFTAIVPVGSKMRLTGKVVEREIRGSETSIKLELEAILESGVKALSGQAVVVFDV